MRVLLGPGTHALDDEVVGTVCDRMVGSTGTLLPLGLSRQAFRRALTGHEIRLVRKGLLGVDPDSYVRTDDAPSTVVGYICAGVAHSGRCEQSVVAVADHVNLAWRSPLVGPNDDRLGPRFPVIGGVYVPGRVAEALGAAPGVVFHEGVVAGVRDDTRLLRFEADMIRVHGYLASSCELVPVALLAAHLGFRLAAVVVSGWD